MKKWQNHRKIEHHHNHRLRTVSRKQLPGVQTCLNVYKSTSLSSDVVLNTYDIVHTLYTIAVTVTHLSRRLNGELIA